MHRQCSFFCVLCKFCNRLMRHKRNKSLHEQILCIVLHDGDGGHFLQWKCVHFKHVCLFISDLLLMSDCFHVSCVLQFYIRKRLHSSIPKSIYTLTHIYFCCEFLFLHFEFDSLLEESQKSFFNACFKPKSIRKETKKNCIQKHKKKTLKWNIVHVAELNFYWFDQIAFSSNEGWTISVLIELKPWYHSVIRYSHLKSIAFLFLCLNDSIRRNASRNERSVQCSEQNNESQSHCFSIIQSHYGQ